MATTHPATAHPVAARRVPMGIGLLALVLAGLLAACGAAPPRLATSPAERASWPSAPPNAVAARVERVVDGDTFVAEIGGLRERVRVIGVDTPETVAPGRPVERYGRESSGFAKRELTGVTVRLGGDVEPRDRYDRLLAYVWLPDGTFWNALLAAEGYAQLLTVPPNVAYVDLFRRLVAEARAAHRGLWSGDA
jgi:endonuclease YncB( thermonuclease family)